MTVYVCVCVCITSSSLSNRPGLCCECIGHWTAFSTKHTCPKKRKMSCVRVLDISYTISWWVRVFRRNVWWDQKSWEMDNFDEKGHVWEKYLTVCAIQYTRERTLVRASVRVEVKKCAVVEVDCDFHSTASYQNYSLYDPSITPSVCVSAWFISPSSPCLLTSGQELFPYLDSIWRTCFSSETQARPTRLPRWELART